MDSVTQAVLGAAVGQAVLGRRLGWKAAALGAVGGTLPDLDVLWSDADAVSYFLGHRGVTHSLFFGPLLALPLAWASRRWKPDIALAPWWCFWMLVLVTHVLLDLTTNYGTQLLAPFSREPFAIPAMSIIDPVYTLTLALGLGLALAGRYRALTVAFVLSTAYIGVAALQNERALQLARAQTSLPTVQATTMLGSPWLRRVMAWNDSELQIGFVSTWNPQPIRWQRIALEPRAVQLARDAEASPRGQVFVRFAKGPRHPFMHREPDGREELRIADARFGVPGSDSLSGFWGLAVPIVDGQLQVDQAYRFQRLRAAPEGGFAALWAATWGQPQPLF